MIPFGSLLNLSGSPKQKQKKTDRRDGTVVDLQLPVQSVPITNKVCEFESH